MNFSAALHLGGSQLSALKASVEQMDALSTGTCIVILFLGLVCIGRLLTRGYRLLEAKDADRAFLLAFEDLPHSLSLFQEGRNFSKSPRFSVYQAGCKEIAFHLLGMDTVNREFSQRLRAAGRITPAHMDTVRRAMLRIVNRAGLTLRKGLYGAALPTLPLVGLAGTILSTIAHSVEGLPLSPGALLVPLAAGVLLFIPLLLWHDFLGKRANALEAGMQDLTLELSRLFDRQFVDHRNPLETLPSIAAMGLDVGPSLTQPPADPAAAFSLPPH